MDCCLSSGGRWPVLPLAALVDILDRRRKPITKSDRISGPYPYYGATGVLDHVHDYIFDEPLVLIGEDGAKWGAGDPSAFSIDGKTWVNNHAHVLRPNRHTVLDSWLIYYLNATDLADFISGMTVPKLNQARMREIPIPLPPLEEQRRIIALLDQAFAALDRARDNAEANLENVEHLLESELRLTIECAGNSKERLSFNDLCTTVTPKVKIQRREYLTEGAYPIVSQESDLVSGFWDDPDALMAIGAPVVIFGDHTRCLKYIDFDFVVGADGTKILKPNNGICAKYLYYGFKSNPIKETGYARHFKAMRQTTLPKIALSEQNLLASRLSEIEGKCDQIRVNYAAKITELAQLRQSLLQKAFAGQLTRT